MPFQDTYDFDCTECAGRSVEWTMTIAAALMLLLQEEHRRSATLEALCYLSRHQRPDGSWGARPESCTCPEPEAPALGDPESADRLLRELGDEDPAIREKATAGLRALGESVLPRLRAAALHPDPEIRGRCTDLCGRYDRIARSAPDAELTGLALLALLDSGYSHLSRDSFDGINFGTAVKVGLGWLMQRQRETGAYDPEDAVSDAIAALALSEAFGMTAAPTLKDAAQKGVDRIVARPMKGERELLWKGILLRSAELSELTIPRKAAEETCSALRALDGDRAVAGSVLTSYTFFKRREPLGWKSLPGMDLESLHPETLYVASLAAYCMDGPAGGLWRNWRTPLERRLLTPGRQETTSCARGAWLGADGRGNLQSTALATITLVDTCYRRHQLFQFPGR